MQDSSNHEKICPSCKKIFFPDDNVVTKTFCGEELICLPSEEKHNAPECKEYGFCSEKCLEEFTNNAPACAYIPGWKRLMEKIGKVSKSSGIAGSRPHDLHKTTK